MFLTQSKTPIIGWFATILGLIMNLIFNFQSHIGIGNIGLCIILFTIVINLLMTPLTIQQQKFSRLSAKMNPELQAIQKKYKGKKGDQTAMAKMNEETQAVYAKYGVNPMGSCIQMAIQIPVLFALYRVIWNIPAYVDKVKAVFLPVADGLLKANGAQEYLTEAAGSLHVAFKEMTQPTIVDVLYKFKAVNWADLTKNFPSLSDVIETAHDKIDRMNYFLGLNIAESPFNIITDAFKSKAFLLILGAALIPILAAVTQWISAKLMTTMTDNSRSGEQEDTMASSMRTMNNVMPLMSAFFCLTLPVGLGIYWIAGAVVRSVQQVIINKKVDKMDLDELMKENLDKINKSHGIEANTARSMKEAANMKTSKIDVRADQSSAASSTSSTTASSGSSSSSDAPKRSSIASRAMMVQEYNDKHNKK